jgi:hypothetical protein
MPKTPTKTQTTPKGYEIPVPTRKEVYEALEKVAKRKPRKQQSSDDPVAARYLTRRS